MSIVLHQNETKVKQDVILSRCTIFKGIMEGTVFIFREPSSNNFAPKIPTINIPQGLTITRIADCKVNEIKIGENNMGSVARHPSINIRLRHTNCQCLCSNCVRYNSATEPCVCRIFAYDIRELNRLFGNISYDAINCIIRGEMMIDHHHCSWIEKGVSNDDTIRSELCECKNKKMFKIECTTCNADIPDHILLDIVFKNDFDIRSADCVGFTVNGDFVTKFTNGYYFR